jgi:hypothetical protein
MQWEGHYLQYMKIGAASAVVTAHALTGRSISVSIVYISMVVGLYAKCQYCITSILLDGFFCSVLVLANSINQMLSFAFVYFVYLPN